MLENDATEIPTRISTGFPLQRKEKREKIVYYYALSLSELESQIAKHRILIKITSGWIKHFFFIYF